MGKRITDPKRIKTLTDPIIKGLKPQAASYEIADAVVPGLFIRVQPSGFKGYTLHARPPGKSFTRLAIARYGEKPLADVRDIARDWLRKISEGNDPKTSAQRERIETIKQREITFRVLADAYLRPNAEHRTAAKVRRVIYDAILLPVLGDRPVIDLVASDITTLTDKIAEVGSDRALVELGIRTKLRHPERPARPTVVMARSVYVQAERVLEYAVGCGHLAKSPIAHIQKAKKFKGAVNARDRAFTEAWEIETFWRATRHMLKPQKQFWQLLMLTGVRLSELADASWDEFDLDGSDGLGPVWKIPKARMKQNRDHIVPLTPLMLSILREIPEQPNGPFVFSYSFGERPWVYGGFYKKEFDEAITVEAGKIGKTFEPWVNHDLRRTLRHVRLLPSIRADWETVELLLAHKLPGMTGRYDPFQRLAERRDALTKWGEHIVGLTKPKRVALPRAA
jgi:integrase